MSPTITLPSIAELTERAIAGTRFIEEVTGQRQPLHVRIAAEIAAGLAAEAWEADAGRPLGMTVPMPLINAVADGLVERSAARGLRADVEAAEARIAAAVNGGARC